MSRWTVLSIPLQLVFPGHSLKVKFGDIKLNFWVSLDGLKNIQRYVKKICSVKRHKIQIVYNFQYNLDRLGVNFNATSTISMICLLILDVCGWDKIWKSGLNWQQINLTSHHNVSSKFKFERKKLVCLTINVYVTLNV